MKKLLICLAAVSMIVCGSCAEKKNDSDEAAPAVSSSAVEEGKFDFYGTVSDMKICGQNVSLPCKFGELGEGFSHDEPIEAENHDYMFTTMRYNDTDIGTIYLELRDDGKYDDAQIVSMMLNTKSEVYIKGVTLESSEEDVKNALGEDFVKNEYTLDYGSENDGLVRILMNGMTDTPMSVTVIMPSK